MVKFKITEKDAEEMKKAEGKTRGQAIISTFHGVLFLEGQEGLIKLEKKLRELNSWVENYTDFDRRIKAFEWYPIWYDMIPMVAAADVFEWDEEKIKQFGINAQKTSFFEKILLKYFISLKTTFEAAGGRWKQHYSVGRIEVTEVNEKEKMAKVQLKDFIGHPVVCYMLVGYFQEAVVLAVGSPTKCQEVKCVFRGDPYHEFLFTWGK